MFSIDCFPGLPKYIREARAIDPVERVEYAVKKALPKLSLERCNLVAVVDDLFFSPTEIPTEILNGRLNNTLAHAEYRPVAGVYLLNPVSFTDSAEVEYRTYFIQNKNADRPLPIRFRTDSSRTAPIPTVLGVSVRSRRTAHPARDQETAFELRMESSGGRVHRLIV